MIAVEVPARAALAGNPSDLYGGAVLAVPVPSLRARVEFTPGPTLEIDGHPGARHLVEAAAARAGIRGRLRWRSTIPVAVGLAGSSAIVISVLRLASPADPLDLALEAQAVERDDLGLNAGLQDRAVQAFEQPVLVDVSGSKPEVSALKPARPVRLLVAWLPPAAADSDDYHAGVRRTADLDGMRELGDIGRAAARAFAEGDTEVLIQTMAASAALRTRVAPLSDAHNKLVAAVAGAGLVANSTGSGGAVAAVVTDANAIERAQAAVVALGGDWLVETYG